MDITKARCRAHSFPFLLGLSAFVAAVLTFGAHIAAAQTADTDGDGYADGVEQQLGSDPNDPESTPESFTLLWTCTDGNDNDRDGKRDFNDPGCRNTAPGSTPAPTATPAPNGPSDSGASPGGNGSGSDGVSTDGSSDGGRNAVLQGAGAPLSRGPPAAERVQVPRVRLAPMPARIRATQQARTATSPRMWAPLPGPIPPQGTRPLTTGAASPGRFRCSSSCFC